MRKKLIAALMAVSMMIPSFCYAGIPEDKQKHIGVAAGLDLAMAECGVKKETRWSILGGLFVAKEIYDHNKGHATHDHLGDLAADVGGVVIGEGVIWIVHGTF